MKIQSRLDYFFIPKFLQKLIQECRIMPNIFSDHSALILIICFDEETVPRGPGYWRFNNSLLSDNEYVALLGLYFMVESHKCTGNIHSV